jgi:hypothetical protein
MANPHSLHDDHSWAAWDGCLEEDDSSARRSPTHSRITSTTAVPVSGHGVVERADGSAARRLTVYLPVDLYRRVKLHAAGLDCNLSELVAGLLDRELSKQG